MRSLTTRIKDRFIYCFRQMQIAIFAKCNTRGRVLRDWNPDSNYLHHKLTEIDFLWQKWLANNKDQNSFDFARFYSILLNINHVLENNVSGSIAELGVYKGNSAYFLSHFSMKFNRKLYLYDTFEGFDKRDLKGADKKFKEGCFSDTSLEYIKSFIGEAEYRLGYCPDSIKCEDKKESFALYQ